MDPKDELFTPSCMPGIWKCRWRQTYIVLLLLLLAFLATPSSSPAQTAALTEQLGRTVLFDDIAVSPDGKWVAWVQGMAASSSKATYISPTAEDSHSQRIEIGAGGERYDTGPAWSPDSKTLAFFSAPGETNQAQLWTVNADCSNPQERTTLNGYAARPRWSHDGKQIAFLYIESAGGGGPLLAAPAMTGVIDDEIHNQRLAVVDTSTAKMRQVSPANLHIYDYDWSPDDAMFVTTAAPGPGDNNWWIAQIYTINAKTGEAQSIYKSSLQVAIPRWSPDGKSVAFIEGLMSDEGFHGGDLFTMSAQGRDLANRTKGRKASVSALFWTELGKILFTETVGGASAISELALAQNEVRTIWKGAEVVRAFGNYPNFAMAPDGKFVAGARSSFQQAPEAWVGPVGEWHQLTHENAAQSPAWGKVENLEWTNEGQNIQGWILPPKQVEQGKHYPMVVIIHGGPSSAAMPGWPAKSAYSAILASQGYFILMPNPRGSYGQGEDFTRANVKDLGGGDLRDILAGVDAALARYPIDPNRLGVSGWSYGGYMTMWTVTQTKRFRAAMAGAGIANWQSYYGQNLIDQWMIPFFGKSVYEDPAMYEKSSPIRFIKNVSIPTLVIVGERDAECPAAQSFEFWHALKTLGVTTELVVYSGEGHHFMNPTNRIDMQDRTVAWFNKYLKTAEP
ncbi:MAG TPA: S9 family peptidase [Candidatus Limnocylindrales bacterium]|nr:S9 family peptidase [Candidatus Limnocylindrales bacterium]